MINQRLKNLYSLLEKEGLNGLLVCSQSNISYLTGFPSRESYLLVSPKKNYFITDFRYFYEAKRLPKNIRVELINGSLFRKIAELAKAADVVCLGFEAKNISYAEVEKIKEELTHKVEFIPAYDIVEGLRSAKDDKELSVLVRAVKIAVETMNFARKIIKPGMTEVFVKLELQRFIEQKNGCKPAFEIIVASGPNSSYPHHISSGRKLKKNEPVLIDLGVDFHGYKSDLTRTIFLGKIPPAFRKVYAIVLEAQKRAIDQISAGITAKDVDSKARQYIAYKGYGRYFGHSTGHGIGLEVHEDPHISPKSKDILRESMVFTVEPAIYLAGKFGIRIEDMVVVRKKGCEVLSSDLYKSI